MEIQIEHTYPTTGAYNNYLAIGVDNTNVIENIKLANAKYQTGLFNLYFDNPQNYNNVQTITPELTTLSKATISTTGNKTNPRVVVIKRSTDGTLSATVDGVYVNMPTYQQIATANTAEDLYAFIAGVDNLSYFKVTYFGQLRTGSGEEPDIGGGEEPDIGGGEEPEVGTSSFTMGTNATLNADGLFTATAYGYGNAQNIVIYKEPLKAGMEIELIQTNTNTGNFVGFQAWGVDGTTEISEIKAVSNYQTGMFTFYVDQDKDNVQSLGYGVLSPKIELGVNGGQTSPRVSVIKRDASGKLSGTFGGQAITMPNHAGVTAANETENLYVWFPVTTTSTWKINYFGELRS
jgi:hypothetical protein